MSTIIQIIFGISVMATVYKACSVASSAFKLAKQGMSYSKLIKQFLIISIVFASEFTAIFLAYGYYSAKDIYNLLMLYAFGLFSTYTVRQHAAKIYKKNRLDQ